MTATSGDDAIATLALLEDPTRRRLYDYVADRAQPVTRDEASEALGLDRSVVAYHLDKLADQGLLVISFARPDGRGGPGAGRPAKHYERADVEIAASLPPRDYRLVADLLARAAETDATGTVREALDEAADEAGRKLARGRAGEQDSPRTRLRRLLAEQGFEPYDDGDSMRLGNCPFDRIAQDHTELICRTNLALLRGLLEAADLDVEARLDPAPGRCCVAFS